MFFFILHAAGYRRSDREGDFMKISIDKLKTLTADIETFFRRGVWRIRSEGLSPGKAMGLRLLRTFVLTANGFQKDNCVLRASALTFYTFLSIVPILAMAFGIAKGFGFEDMLRKVLIENFIFQQEALTKVIEFAQELLEKTKGGVMAGIGVATLLWTVIKVLSHIETSLNQIWKVRKARSMGRKFNDYFAIMIICPILTFLHSSISVFITVRVKEIVENVGFVGIFSPVIFSVLKLLPYMLIWIILIYLYKAMPYTDVKPRSAAIAGIFAGTVFQAAQWGYLTFQVGVAQYNAIYGSFAAIPLFLLWLQVSWLIVLFGAEFSHAFENAGDYEFEPDTRRLSYSRKKTLYLAVAKILAKNFAGEKPPSTASEISEALEVPVSFVALALDEMIDAGLVSEAGAGKDGAARYQPARDVRLYTIFYILNEMEKNGADFIRFDRNPNIESLENALENFGELLRNSPENRHLNDL